MRVLMTSLPAQGHINSTLAVAAALSMAGHDVAYCCASSFRGSVEALGYRHFVGGYEDVSELFAGRPPLDRAAAREWAFEHVWAGEAARRMAKDVLACASRWQPDLIIRESLEYGGCLAAEVLGLPHASIATSSDSALEDRRHVAAEAVAVRRDELGLPPDPEREMFYRYLHLCFMPALFHGPGARFPATAHFFRHVNDVQAGQSPPAWFRDLPESRTVFASLGTNHKGMEGVFSAIIAALRDEPLNLVVAIGRDHDPARLGRQTPNVRIERYVPQPLLLQHCAAFVTHGGFNGTKEALSAGVPLVIIPLGGDQFYTAERCTALGVGRMIAPDERTSSDAIRRGVRAVLGGPPTASVRHGSPGTSARSPRSMPPSISSRGSRETGSPSNADEASRVKTLGLATEDEVVAVFLRAEVDSPKRAGELIRAWAPSAGLGLDELRRPDSSDRKANAKRRGLLRRVRGFFFKGFPQDVAWTRAVIEKKELRRLRYLNYGNWRVLAPETRTVVEGVRSIREEASAIPEIDLEGCEAIASRLRNGEQMPELILVHNGDPGAPYVVIEGNSRVTAYVAFPDALPDAIEVLVGTSSSFGSWPFY